MRARSIALLLTLVRAVSAQPLPEPTPAAPAPTSPSLTARFEDDLATQEWTLIKGGPLPEWRPPTEAAPLPLTFFLADASTGARAAMNPAAYFTTGDRQRWGGRTLGVDWVLVLDGTSNELLQVSGQWKASTPRVLSVEAGVAMSLRDWTWHDGPDQSRQLQPDTPPCHSSTDTPLGFTGRQALYPISVLSRPDRALILETARTEPLTFDLMADVARNWWGVQVALALDPRTVRFPGRAAFAFTLRTQTQGGPTAFRHAWEELRTGPATHSYQQVEAAGWRTDDETVAAAEWPLVYLREEGRPGLAQPVRFDLQLPAREQTRPVEEVKRLRAAGWRPLGDIQVREAGVRLDEYGSATTAVRHLILHSTSAWPQVVHVEIPPAPEPTLLADPESGSVQWVHPSPTPIDQAVHLEPGGEARRELFAWPALDEVREFYRSEAPATPGHMALLNNLDSLAKTHALEIDFELRIAQPVAAERDHPLLLVLSNRGPHAITMQRAELQREAGPQSLLTESLVLDPGQHAELTGYLDHASLQAPFSWLTFFWSLERQGAAVEGSWTERLEVAEPLWTRMETGRVVTLEENLTLPVQVWNRSELPQAVTLSSVGDFLSTSVQHTLEAGEQREMELVVTASETRPGRMQVIVAIPDRVCLRQDLQLEFLAPDASLARDHRVTVESSGVTDDRTAEAVRDGDYATTWTSSSTTPSPWIRYRFPAPTAVSSVRLIWPAGQASQHGILRGETAAGDVLELAAFTNTSEATETELIFAETQLNTLELRQPVGAGPPDQPNLLWLNELEVR